MSWNDRLREASYTSASGNRIVFLYEDVSLSFEKKTTAFEFPDANGTFVQELGNSSRRYPLRVIFSGNDYDLEALEFERALLERGVGKLDHPIYGSVNVVPFGAVSRRDDLKTAANQAIFEVTFWETIGLIYPDSAADPSSSVLSSVENFNEISAQAFDEIVDVDNAVDRVTFRNFYNNLLNSTEDVLRTIADTQEDISKQFNAISSSINRGIDVLIAQPLTLAFQTTQLIQAPARAATSIQDRLDAYGNLATLIITGDNAVTESNNEFQTNDLYASNYVASSVLSVVNTTFDTRPQAIEAAERILGIFDEVQAWRELNFGNLGEIDTGESYQALQESVAICAGFLIQISFSLRQERTIILDRDRTIIDLAAELYGSVDDQLDFIINTNRLTGSEILELKKGREIVYYV